MKKRIFGLLLCFLVMMAMVPVLAIADGEMVTVSFDMKGHGTGAPVDQTIPKGTPAVEPVEPCSAARREVLFWILDLYPELFCDQMGFFK